MRANRLAVIIDAADYFATVKAAVQRARHSVRLIGWDFDTRIILDPRENGSDVPNRLGNGVVAQNLDLTIHMLRGDRGTSL